MTHHNRGTSEADPKTGDGSLSAAIRKGRKKASAASGDGESSAAQALEVPAATPRTMRGVAAGAKVASPKPRTGKASLADRLQGGPDDAASVPDPSALSSNGKPGTAIQPAPLVSDEAASATIKHDIRNQTKEEAEKQYLRDKEAARRAKKEKADAKREKQHLADLKKHQELARRVSQQLGLDPNRPITAIPEMEGPERSQVEFITVQPDRAFIRVVFDKTSNHYLYECIEPQLTETEREILGVIRDTLVRTLEARPRLSDEQARAYLTRAMDQAILDHSILIDEVSRERIKYFLLRDFLGYGPIDVLMRDPMIEDISCDGPKVPLFIFHRSYESIKTNVVFESELELDPFVIRLAQRSGKQISIADPLLDATLPDKSRLQASLSKEVTTRGSSFTIRRFRSDPLTPTDLCRLGTLSPEMAAFFWFTMEEGASILFAGGTASGKTSTLNAISSFIPPQKKIVSIEDTREINLPHENWIAGLTRTGFGGEVVAGKIVGTIDMYKLLEAALRQRPEYLLVGEVRGREAQTLFQAMATGHATYSTLHGDSVQSAVYRLENPPIEVPRIMLQTLGAIAVQVQARVNYRLVRRIKEVVEIVGIDPETKDLLTNAVFEWDNTADSYRYLGKSVILEKIMARRNWSADKVEREWANRTLVLEWMLRKGVRKMDDVVRVISAYYSTPETLLIRVRDQMKEPSGSNDDGGAARGA